MNQDTPDYNLKAIRKLLLAAFTAQDLHRFCLDDHLFRPICDRFGPNHGFDDMVDEVITYCNTHLLFPELLAEIRKVNPRQYDLVFGSQLPAVEVGGSQEVQPAELTPESPTSPTIPFPPIRDDEKPPMREPAGLMIEIPTALSPIPLHLVRVPAGQFQMGSELARDQHASPNEGPEHRFYLPEFYIGMYPVTNRQYQPFIRAKKRQVSQHREALEAIPRGREDHPVVGVTWHDAVAFCAWLSSETGQRVRLPTEAEWEKAARGIDGRIYPWGKQPPDSTHCNFNSYVGDTSPVGKYSPQGDSPYGCADMAGNVFEWCQSSHGRYPYEASDGREDIKVNRARVLRGGCWSGGGKSMRCTDRLRRDPVYSSKVIGFRIVTEPLG